jgi:phosphoglycerate dehydrogenase-like enzyme
MSETIVITGRDVGTLSRAVERGAGVPIRWLKPDDPDAASAEIWFCAGQPPEPARDLPGLKWIHSGWAGVEPWFTRPEWRADVALTRTVGDFPERIAQHVFGYLLAWELGVPEALRQMAAREWKKWVPGTLAGRTLLIVGYGAIGRAIRQVGTALWMEVLGIRRGPIPPAEAEPAVFEASALESLLPRGDVVVNLLPATPATTGFWSRARLRLLPAGSVFVNVSRGATVDEPALLEGLAEGRPAKALLDVFRIEPLSADDPLRASPNVWITPHVAGIGTVERMASEFVANWRRYREGAPLRHLVSRERGY